MLLIAAASIIAAASPADVPPGQPYGPPTVRATGNATVRLVTAAVIHWNELDGASLPPVRTTTVALDGGAVEAKLIEFQ